MSKFNKGDRVRCIQTWTTYVIERGGEYTVHDVRPDNVADVMEAFVCGQWVPFSYFELVEPEWVVGQQVSGGDYASLPVGTEVNRGRSGALTKTGEDEWTDPRGLSMPNAALGSTRTLTHLGDGTPRVNTADLQARTWPVTAADMRTHSEPDATDAYVEPEPLKEGEHALLWVQVGNPVPDEDGDITVHMFDAEGRQLMASYTRPDAIVLPSAGQVPPWVKPARCTSLVECDEGAGVYYLRCSRPPHKDDAHRLTDHGSDDLAWTDSDEGVVRIEAGAS